MSYKDCKDCERSPRGIGCYRPDSSRRICLNFFSSNQQRQQEQVKIFEDENIIEMINLIIENSSNNIKKLELMIEELHNKMQMIEDFLKE